jgi:hypothetical protein
MNKTDLPSAKIFRIMIEHLTGATYPTKTLDRRLGLLTDKEMALVVREYEKMANACHKLDDIIAERAEKEQDKWP